MLPAPVALPAISCPRCGEALADDPDGTACRGCGGLLVARSWADGCLPDMGRAALSPVYSSTAATLPCPSCARALSPVLCHGVAAWSCARCRWLFFDGLKHKELTEPAAPVAAPPRALADASLVAVTAGTPRRGVRPGDVVGLVVLAAALGAALVSFVG